MTRKINPKSLENLKKGKPFVKGDPRINPGGKVKNFDELRVFLQEIANETVQDERSNKISRLREIVLGLSEKDFLEFAYGKVPVENNVNLRAEVSWKNFVHGSDSDTNSDASSE